MEFGEIVLSFFCNHCVDYNNARYNLGLFLNFTVQPFKIGNKLKVGSLFLLNFCSQNFVAVNLL